ncbi:hypothetical protein VTK56DRAFT_9326 [Thermocarpiscus australiensis]
MCFHKRLIFGCGHYAWLGISRPCEVEQSFNRGEVDTGCNAMWSHGYDAIRVQKDCPRCAKLKKRQELRLGVVKERLKAIKEQVKQIKGIPEVEDDEKMSPDSEAGSHSDNTAEDDASRCASSPVKTDDTGNTSLEELDHANESMDEVRFDPKRRPLKLPQMVGEQKAKGAEATKAALDGTKPAAGPKAAGEAAQSQEALWACYYRFF